MEYLSIFELLKEVLTSWQVIVATLVIFCYLRIISYVSRRYHRPRALKKVNVNLFKKIKKSRPVAVQEQHIDELHDADSNDELGLEEA